MNNGKHFNHCKFGRSSYSCLDGLEGKNTALPPILQNVFVFMNLPNQSRELVPTPITGLSRNSRLINKKTTTPIWYKRSRKRNICAWKTIKKESKHSLTRDYINLFLISLAVEFNSDE